MAITYGSQTGTTITTHAMNEILASQSQQTGNNTVVASNVLSVIGNGQIGNGTNGIGDSYVGRLLIIDLGLSTEQRRMCISDAAGTGTTRILTVHEDWDTNPAATTDTIHVPYEAADIEDSAASGGVAFTARTGIFTFSNDLTIANTGGLQIMNGTGWEMDDVGNAVTFFHQSGGYFYSGYEAGNGYINGGEILFVNNTATEPSYQAASGSIAYLYDLLWWAQLVAMQIEFASGSDVQVYGGKLLNFTNELHLFDSTVRKGFATGKGATTEIVRVNANTDVVGLVLSNLDTLETASGDTTTETVTLRDVLFSNVTDLITLVNNKTFNMDNPIWGATLHSDFNSAAVTGSATINDRRTVDAIVQEADGTKLQNALVNVYENTLTDLVQELTTDVNGIAAGSFNYLEHVWTTGTGATTTRSGHALQCAKWLYLPFVSAQASDVKFDGTIVLASDPNIVQTTQATAITDGSGITWSEPTNATELVDFTLGSGTAAVGMILTFSPSGAIGTLREHASGDSVAGELYLDVRNATAIANGDTFSRTGGTAGTFSGTYTNDSKQSFSISINANAKALQTTHDYLAARQTETTLSADGELIWEWCRAAQTKAFYATGSSFYTERSNSKGIYVYNRGAGSLDYLTDDAGVTWTPPTSVTVQVTVTDASTGSPIATTARVYLEILSGHVEVLNSATNGSGIASTPYDYTADQPVVGWAREWDLTGTDYTPKNLSGTITSAGLFLNVELEPAE